MKIEQLRAKRNEVFTRLEEMRDKIHALVRDFSAEEHENRDRLNADFDEFTKANEREERFESLAGTMEARASHRTRRSAARTEPGTTVAAEEREPSKAPTPDAETRALAIQGWMLRASGPAAVGSSLLARFSEPRPQRPEADLAQDDRVDQRDHRHRERFRGVDALRCETEEAGDSPAGRSRSRPGDELERRESSRSIRWRQPVGLRASWPDALPDPAGAPFRIRNRSQLRFQTFLHLSAIVDSLRSSSGSRTLATGAHDSCRLAESTHPRRTPRNLGLRNPDR